MTQFFQFLEKNIQTNFQSKVLMKFLWMSFPEIGLDHDRNFELQIWTVQKSV